MIPSYCGRTAATVNRMEDASERGIEPPANPQPNADETEDGRQVKAPDFVVFEEVLRRLL